MSDKCPKCGEPMVQMVREGGRYVWPHKTGGVACLAHQLAQALERAVSAEEAYLKRGFRLDTEKARAEKAEAERNELFFASDELQCDIASALGWDCHGIVFHRLVRGYVMAHEMERAEVERLRERQKDDEGLIQRAIEALSTGIALPCRDATIAEMGLTIDALRARLGEAAQGEEADDGEAKGKRRDGGQ